MPYDSAESSGIPTEFLWVSVGFLRGPVGIPEDSRGIPVGPNGIPVGPNGIPAGPNGIPMGFLWDSYGIPMEFLWNPTEFLRNSAELRPAAVSKSPEFAKLAVLANFGFCKIQDFCEIQDFFAAVGKILGRGRRLKSRL